MSEVNKLREDFNSLMADLRKAVDAKKGGAPVDSKALEDKFEKRLAEAKQAMAAEMRKGSFQVVEREDRLAPDVLLEKSDNPKVKEFQKWNDDVLLTSTLMRTHPRNLKLFQKRFSDFQGVSELRKAMDTATSNEGAEWIPTDFSSDLIDKVRLEQKVAALFPEIMMPTPTYKIPGVKGDGAVYLVPENTADTGQTKPTASTPTTRVVTLSATKLGSANRFSLELQEDSIIPILDFIKQNMAETWADAFEDALINGDTTSTHMDADVTSSSDNRKAWKGLRKLAQAATTTSLTATPTAAELRTMRSKMGKYGMDKNKLAWICSTKGFMKLLGMAELITVDKYGPAATIITGEVAKIDGIPVIVSSKMRDDLNASGVNDSTTNSKGLLLLVYLPAFVRGSRRKMTAWSRYEGEYDQTVLVTLWRGDFKPLYDETTEPIVAQGVNWAV